MTAEEKAKDLIQKVNIPSNYLEIEFEKGYKTDDYGISDYYAVDVSLIFVEEILYHLTNSITSFVYWDNVKKELQKIRESL